MSNEPTSSATRQRSSLGTVGAVLGAVVSGLYLLNLTFGIFELPDNLPIIGNLDEVVVSSFFFGCMGYLGINLVPFQRRRRGGGER